MCKILGSLRTHYQSSLLLCLSRSSLCHWSDRPMVIIILQKNLTLSPIFFRHCCLLIHRLLIAEAEAKVWNSCLMVDSVDLYIAMTFLVIGNVGWLLYFSGSIVQSVKGPRDGCITRCIPNPTSNTNHAQLQPALEFQNQEFVSMQSRIMP